jgi:hypothetical protein
MGCCSAGDESSKSHRTALSLALCHSAGFVSDPHTAIVGKPQGEIRNLVDARAEKARDTLLGIAQGPLESVLSDARRLSMPMHHDVRAKDVEVKRLGAVSGSRT